MLMLGGWAIYNTSPLVQWWLDLNAARAHVASDPNLIGSLAGSDLSRPGSPRVLRLVGACQSRRDPRGANVVLEGLDRDRRLDVTHAGQREDGLLATAIYVPRGLGNEDLRQGCPHRPSRMITERISGIAASLVAEILDPLRRLDPDQTTSAHRRLRRWSPP